MLLIKLLVRCIYWRKGKLDNCTFLTKPIAERTDGLCVHDKKIEINSIFVFLLISIFPFGLANDGALTLPHADGNQLDRSEYPISHV